MGIQGLLPLLKSITEHTHIKYSAQQTLGVDAYVWLHRGAFACAQDLALGKHTVKYVDYAMHRVKMLQHYGVTPYIVFDGDYLPSKAKTECEREEKRSENTRLGKAALASGNKKAAQEYFQKAIDVTPDMALRFIHALQEAKVEYVVAPYEADAQLAYLDKMNIIDGVVTEDSDLLVFGCKKVLYKLNEFGECREIKRSNMGDNNGLRFDGWNDDMFRYMAILSGCDYLASLPGMGLKTAHRLVRRYRTLDKLFKGLTLEYGMRVPADYEQNFHRADRTFVHQMVFCPLKKQMVNLVEPLVELDEVTTKMVGIKLDDDIARAVADGSIDPITKQLIVLPEARPGLKHANTAPAGNMTMDKFLKPQPLAPRSVNVETPKRPAPRLSVTEQAHAKKLKLFESSPDRPQATGKENKISKFFASKEAVKCSKEEADLAAAIEASKAAEKLRQEFEGFQNPVAFEVEKKRETAETSPFFTANRPPMTPGATGLPSPPDSQVPANQVVEEWRQAFTLPTTPVTPSIPFSSSLRRLGGQVLKRSATTSNVPKLQRQPFIPQSASQGTIHMR